MLIPCPECELQVSDKAVTCPHCGYPLKTTCNNRAKNKRKRMRLPNGFGQITELKGQNLRKPFRAMVTIGKTDEGKPICKLLQPEAYFKTYNEAYEALLKYNKDPYSLSCTMTLGELYEKWSNEYYKTVTKGVIVSTKAAWKYCESIKDVKLVELRGRHIKQCLEYGGFESGNEIKYPSANVKNKMKVMLNQMLDYAIEYELIDKNYARGVSISKVDRKEMTENRRSHIPYTDEEIEKLWKNINTNPIIDIILIQCYTGWRPKELEIMKISDVDLEIGTMKGGVKTKAGKGRIVPIHSKIYELVSNRYQDSINKGSEYLFTMEKRNVRASGQFRWFQFETNLNRIKDELGLSEDHRPHDGRAHFITIAKKYHVDEYAIKRMVGHEIKDITENVYTTRDIEWLKEEIEKIK